MSFSPFVARNALASPYTPGTSENSPPHNLLLRSRRTGVLRSIQELYESCPFRRPPSPIPTRIPSMCTSCGCDRRSNPIRMSCDTSARCIEWAIVLCLMHDGLPRGSSGNDLLAAGALSSMMVICANPPAAPASPPIQRQTSRTSLWDSVMASPC